MEKILLVLDALKPSFKAIDFACWIANLTHSKVTGVFLENVLANTSAGVTDGIEYDESVGTTDLGSPEQKRKCFEKHIINFNEACAKRNVLHTIHRDRGIPASEIIEESRFADLIIVDPRTSFERKYEGAPTDFVKVVLEKAECAVILAPENFESLDKIIFTYDGSKSSVFAIKQFTYLFPQLKNKVAAILQITKENNTTITQKYKLNEWLKMHYDNIEIKTLMGDSKYSLVDYMLDKKNVFLVMGAYGKNILSQFFYSSHADLIIKTIDVSIFIAHY